MKRRPAGVEQTDDMKEAMLLGSEWSTDSVKVGHEPFNSKIYLRGKQKSCAI